MWACFGLTESDGLSATVGDCVSTTVLVKGCSLVPLMVCECNVLSWWGAEVICVSWVGSVGHNWTPVPPYAQHPWSPVPLSWRDYVFKVLAPSSPVVEVI